MVRGTTQAHSALHLLGEKIYGKGKEHGQRAIENYMQIIMSYLLDED